MADTLPDIKPIRTGFLINAAAVSICLILTYVFVEQEMRRMSLANEIRQLENKVSATQAANATHLRLSGEFVREAEKMEDVAKFYEGPVTAYDFLLELASIRPEGLIFDSITFREIETPVRRQIVKSYTLSISGQTKELRLVPAFKNALSQLDPIVKYNGQISETILPPNEMTDIFPFTMEIALTPPN